MTTRTNDPGNQTAPPAARAACQRETPAGEGMTPSKSSVWRIERPSWREALAARPGSAGEARVRSYVARHPGFAHLLHLIAIDDAEEERQSEERPCHTAGLRHIRI